MKFFATLTSDEHPLLIRLFFAFILSLGLVIAVALYYTILLGGWGISNFVLVTPFILAPLLLLGLRLNKAGRLSPFMLLSIPMVFLAQGLNKVMFMGVVTPWPFMTIGVLWVVAVYYSLTKPRLKVSIYSLTTVIVVLLVFLSLPKYTFFEARKIIAQDLGIRVQELKPGLGMAYRIRCLGSSRPSLFVNSAYLFDTATEEIIATYCFDPVSGEWEEIERRPVSGPEDASEPYLPVRKVQTK